MEKIFKLGILVLSAVFLFIFYNNSQNKRYEYHATGESLAVFDKRTGVCYMQSASLNAVIDLIGATVETKAVKKISSKQ